MKLSIEGQELDGGSKAISEIGNAVSTFQDAVMNRDNISQYFNMTHPLQPEPPTYQWMSKS